MFKYLWIIVLVLIFETIILIPIKNRLRLEYDSIFGCVFFGNFMGAFSGLVVSSLFGVLVVSFCEFFNIDWHTIVDSIIVVGAIIGSVIGYVYMIIEEWDD